MITLLIGENGYEVQRTLALLAAKSTGEVEQVDGSELELRQLPDLLMGVTLFASERLVVIKGLADNTALWNELPAWLPRIDDAVHIVLVDAKPDKRTKTYKALQKEAKIIACDFWKATETYAAEKWLGEEAKTRTIALSPEAVQEMIRRATRPSDSDGKLIIDQLRLATVLDQFAGLSGEVTMEHIDAAMAPDIHENIFALFTTALDGDGTRVHEMIAHLSQEEDGHKALGLLASQTANLAALAVGGGRSVDQIASELGIHPFALRSLTGYTRKLSQGEIKRIVEAIADADLRVKRGAPAWSTVETALQKIAL